MATRSSVVETLSSASTNYNDDEPISLLSDNVDRLKALLKKESSHHKEVGQCYDTLRKEYDELLKKYAEAENTIDQYRIASKRQSIELSLSKCDVRRWNKKSKSVQQINFVEGNEDKEIYSRVDRSNSLPAKSFQCDLTSGDNLFEELKLRFEELQNDVQAFEGALVHNEYLHAEKTQIYEALKREFDNINDSFSDIRDEMVEISGDERLSSNGFNEEGFDGELYRLGLRLSEVYDEITEQRNRKDTFNSQKLSAPMVKPNTPQDDVFLENQDVEQTKSSIRFSNDKDHKRKSSHNQRNDYGTRSDFMDSFQSSELSENKHFGDRYLSQSLQPEERPESDRNQPEERSERPPSNPEYVMGNTGTETSYFNQWSKYAKSESGAVARTFDRYSEHPPDDVIDSQKISEERRPNTMNSTEDSGFIEIERIDSRINNFLNNLHVDTASRQSLQNMSPPFHNEQQIRHNETSHRPSSQSSITSNQSRQPKNYYNNKIQSLRNFLELEAEASHQSVSSISDQQNNETHSDQNNNIPLKRSPRKATPRSYVRGKSVPSPTSVQVFMNPSYDPTNRPDETSQEIEENKTFTYYPSTSQNNNHKKSYSGELSRNLLEMPEHHRSRSQDSLVEHSSELRESFPFEHIQDDMREIKDLIIDMRSSLALNTEELNNRSFIDRSYSAPQVRTHVETNHRREDKEKSSRSKLSRHRKERINKSVSDTESLYQTEVLHHRDIKNNHMEVLKRLETKLDTVADEMRGYHIKNNTIDLNNNDIKIPNKQPTLYKSNMDENNNNLTSDIYNMNNNNILQNIADKIDSLSSKIKERKNNESVNTNDDSFREKLIKRIENKIEEIDSQVKLNENSKSTSTHSPVYYSYPCPICGGMNTHKHNGYTHVGVDWDDDYVHEKKRFGNVILNKIADDSNYSFTGEPKTFRSPGQNRNLKDYPHQQHNFKNETDHVTQTSSPNIFHHYHSIYQSTPYPSKQDTPLKTSGGERSRRHLNYEQPAYNEIVERSLANASIAAMNMESISKKMLKTIAADLLNSGPSEY